MPVAPYGSEKYRAWNRDRMRRRRGEGVPWDRNYEASKRGLFIRSTYEGSARRLILRMNRECRALGNRLGEEVEDLEPRQTIADLNRFRDLLGAREAAR